MAKRMFQGRPDGRMVKVRPKLLDSLEEDLRKFDVWVESGDQKGKGAVVKEAQVLHEFSAMCVL